MSKSESPSSQPSPAYQRAGVDLDAGQQAIALYQQHSARTLIPGAITNLGAFTGLFSLRDAGIALGPDADPILVAATDGVGTKLKIAFAMNQHNTIGIDCVAMCVNDILTSGAKPLFFLDYLATGKLDPMQAASIVEGIATGCIESNIALIGGETAEMPGFYAPREYDIAGFCIGIVDRARMIVPDHIQPGDQLIGLSSSGFHSNGFSLIRKVIENAGLDLNTRYPETILASSNQKPETLGEIILKPTRIYVKAVEALRSAATITGLSHITGGGFFENIPRMLPSGLGAKILRENWPVPAIFKFLQHVGKLDIDELYHVFNMGIGMIACVRPTSPNPVQQLNDIINILQNTGFPAYILGEITEDESLILQ